MIKTGDTFQADGNVWEVIKIKYGIVFLVNKHNDDEINIIVEQGISFYFEEKDYISWDEIKMVHDIITKLKGLG